MPGLGTFLAFSAAALALIVVPGPAVIYIVGRSVSQGRAHGLVSALGVATGGLVHVAAAALGVSVIVARSAVAFSTLKFAGAAYLVFLGVQKLRKPSTLSAAVEGASPVSLQRTYVQGFVVNVLNPKTALFFLALLPQFVDPDRGRTVPQVLVLGLLFVALALVSDCCWALASSAAALRLRRSQRALRRLDRGAGVIFIGLGVLAALGDRPRHDCIVQIRLTAMATRKKFDPETTLDRIRDIALALPETHEELTWGEVTLRVRKKIFVFPGRGESMTVKADVDEREALLGDTRFKPAPYLARGGWVQMDLTAAPLDWDEVRELIHTSYCLVAPKTLARKVDPTER